MRTSDVQNTRRTNLLGNGEEERSYVVSNYQRLNDRHQRLSYDSSTSSRTFHVVSTPAPGSYLTVDQRRRNEIVVHGAATVSYHKSYDARGNFVHFAQHSMQNLMQGPGNARSFTNPDSWYNSERVVAICKFLRSPAFSMIILLCSVVALVSPDACVICQVQRNKELDALLTVILSIFVIEFVGLSVVDMSYPLSFFFWMDLFSTLSMAFDISYLLGPDATEPETFIGHRNYLARTSRAARFGGRVGRLTRMLKFLRILLLCGDNGKSVEGKMARAISKQLNAIISTRVAFLTIFVAVILPTFAMFDYPTVDESLSAWALMLSATVEAAQNSTSGDAARHDLSLELKRFVQFYSHLSYGPFKMCYGDDSAGKFQCHPNVIDLTLGSSFAAPRRRNSIWQVTSGNLQICYNLAMPQKFEATINISLIICIIILMTASGVTISGSICEIALEPLESMMSLVRGRCAQIFKYTRELQPDLEEDDIETDFAHRQHVSEFVILEKAVEKLAAIANMSVKTHVEEFTNEMGAEGIMKLNMMGHVCKERLTKVREIGDPVSPNNNGYCDSDGEDMEIGLESPMLISMNVAIPATTRAAIEKPTFNAFAMSRDMKVDVAAYSVLVSVGSENWVRANIQEAKLYSFISAVETKYLPNPYHNFSHALDVLNSVYRLLPSIGAEGFLSDISQFWLLIAAIAHDIGHIGVNNQYLIEVSHELALTYNDRSPLENMHCAKLFQVVNDAETNVFNQIEKDLYKEIRKGIIDAILHTDVVRHQEMMKELGLLYQMNSDAFKTPAKAAEILKSQANTQLIMNALLHIADINNPTRPWEVYHRVAYLILDEFFCQGDLEKAAGIPVQTLNDREKVNRPNSQIGFIEFVIMPVVEIMVSLFPQLDDLAENLGQNIQNWFDVWAEENSPDAEAIEKVQGRVNKVVNRCRDMIRGSSPNKRESQIRRDSYLQARLVSGVPGYR